GAWDRCILLLAFGRAVPPGPCRTPGSCPACHMSCRPRSASDNSKHPSRFPPTLRVRESHGPSGDRDGDVRDAIPDDYPFALLPHVRVGKCYNARRRPSRHPEIAPKEYATTSRLLPLLLAGLPRHLLPLQHF